MSDLGGGLGTGNARPGGPPLARVDSYLRLGMEPDAFIALLIALAVDEEGVDFGLISVRFGAGLNQSIALYLRAELAIAFASARLDAGVRIWLDGDAASASGVALDVGISGAGLLFRPRCAFGPCDERTLSLGPGAHLGLTLRGGD